MQDLIVTIEKLEQPENTHIAYFQGAFDGHNKEPLIELETLVMEGGNVKLIFDFESLSFLNSYAIGQLVAWHNHLEANQGEIIIAHPAKNVEDIFNTVGISSMFKIFPDVPSAVATLTA
ncbi:STAS domain-containing protein [Candidatus Pacearchaeota archaeon]|nr:STAS domain-containing protein [Candidatus Pacearchaeota archaeon]